MISVDEFDRFVFIVGGPRCGTTSLWRFLKQHRSIRFPAIKEPHFFAQQDLRGSMEQDLRAHVERDYLDRFFRRHHDRRIGADASVTYLYAPEQLEPILRLWPESRFVVSVRDPLTMLPSLHRRLIYVGQETIPNFADAWAATSDRAVGRRIPRSCNDPRLLRYDEAPRFGTYIERLFAAVGRERCKVLVFDDLVADPRQQYLHLMEFAGLQPQDDVDLSPERTGQSVRYRWLQRILKQPPGRIKEHLGAEFYRQQMRDPADRDRGAIAALMSIRRRLILWNRVSRPPELLPIALQNEICDRFREEIERLGVLLDRDFSHWLQPGDGSRGAASAGQVGWQYRRAYSY